jgi:hypothetical protein
LLQDLLKWAKCVSSENNIRVVRFDNLYLVAHE